jgi:hypothetical protein
MIFGCNFESNNVDDIYNIIRKYYVSMYLCIYVSIYLTPIIFVIGSYLQCGPYKAIPLYRA